jgi:hypothetical protein
MSGASGPGFNQHGIMEFLGRAAADSGIAMADTKIPARSGMC